MSPRMTVATTVAEAARGAEWLDAVKPELRDEPLEVILLYTQRPKRYDEVFIADYPRVRSNEARLALLKVADASRAHDPFCESRTRLSCVAAPATVLTPFSPTPHRFTLEDQSRLVASCWRSQRRVGTQGSQGAATRRPRRAASGRRNAREDGRRERRWWRRRRRL